MLAQVPAHPAVVDAVPEPLLAREEVDPVEGVVRPDLGPPLLLLAEAALHSPSERAEVLSSRVPPVSADVQGRLRQGEGDERRDGVAVVELVVEEVLVGPL